MHIHAYYYRGNAHAECECGGRRTMVVTELDLELHKTKDFAYMSVTNTFE